ncbi:hypothetical protein [Caenimonas koreensis]|nr:hypothetical protein [Caenimonas koreensis]
MSTPQTQTDASQKHTQDPLEAIMPMVPIVLPVVGGVLIFLLAFIAISMA